MVRLNAFVVVLTETTGPEPSNTPSVEEVFQYGKRLGVEVLRTNPAPESCAGNVTVTALHPVAPMDCPGVKLMFSLALAADVPDVGM
jgi:hypothetical protein